MSIQEISMFFTGIITLNNIICILRIILATINVCYLIFIYLYSIYNYINIVINIVYIMLYTIF